MKVPANELPFPPDPVRPSRAATIVGVSLMTVYRRIRSGHLPAWRDVVTGQLRVSEADVRALWEPRPAPRRERPARASPARREAEQAAALERVRKRLGLDG